MILQSKRLTMRKLTLDDAELMYAVWTDPAYIEQVADRGIRSVDDARHALQERALKLYAEFGYGPYRVALRDCDTAVGICGLFRRDGLLEPDIGYALLPEFYAQGYALEAAQRVLEHAEVDLGLRYVTAIVSPGNTRSVRLLQKLGLEFEKMMQLPGDDAELAKYGIDLTGR